MVLLFLQTVFNLTMMQMAADYNYSTSGDTLLSLRIINYNGSLIPIQEWNYTFDSQINPLWIKEYQDSLMLPPGLQIRYLACVMSVCIMFCKWILSIFTTLRITNPLPGCIHMRQVEDPLVR